MSDFRPEGGRVSHAGTLAGVVVAGVAAAFLMAAYDGALTWRLPSSQPPAAQISPDVLGDRLDRVVWDGASKTVTFPAPPANWAWAIIVTGKDGVTQPYSGVLGSRHHVGDAGAVQVYLCPVNGGVRGTVPVALQKRSSSREHGRPGNTLTP